MVLKINICEKGKSYWFQTEEPLLSGKSIGDKVKGNEVKADLEGYEFEIAGGCDIAGFPMSKDVEGLGLRKVLFTKGFNMRDNTSGLRLRKSVRGKVISESTSLINLNVLKSGSKKLSEIFPEQNKPKEKKAYSAEAPKAA